MTPTVSEQGTASPLSVTTECDHTHLLAFGSAQCGSDLLLQPSKDCNLPLSQTCLLLGGYCLSEARGANPLREGAWYQSDQISRLVVSDSLQPNESQQASLRLLVGPEEAGLGCFVQASLVLHSGAPGGPRGSSSHVQVFAIPWTVACQAPLSMAFSRQESWILTLAPGIVQVSNEYRE